MTRKNNHYDNAMAESLFSRFKAELMQKGTFQNRGGFSRAGFPPTEGLARYPWTNSASD
jgi:hypothetical protein